MELLLAALSQKGGDECHLEIKGFPSNSFLGERKEELGPLVPATGLGRQDRILLIFT